MIEILKRQVERIKAWRETRKRRKSQKNVERIMRGRLEW